jgi:hypothetical protein
VFAFRFSASDVQFSVIGSVLLSGMIKLVGEATDVSTANFSVFIRFQLLVAARLQSHLKVPYFDLVQ